MHAVASRSVPGIVAVLVTAIVLASCGSSSGKSETTSTTATNGAASSAPGVGVTPTQVKVGVALVDFTCIENYVDSIRLDQDVAYRAFIDDVNAKGGVAGRKIVPVFESYCPIGTGGGALAVCTKLTEDEKVFAVIGTFVDFSGDAQQCVAKQHHTPLIAFNLTKAIIDAAPPGLIVYPGATNERVATVLVELLEQQHMLKGRTVAVAGGTDQAAIVKDTIVPALKKQKVKLGSTAILSISSSGDLTAAHAQLDSFIERWKGEGVDAIFLSGDPMAAINMVTKIRQAMPKVLLMTDTGDVRTFGQSLVVKGVKPNPYDGILTAMGPTPPQYDASANWAYCKAIYEKQTGKHAPDGEEVVKGPDGKSLDTYGNVTDACELVTMFHDIGARAGKDLNADTWAATVGSFGKITTRGAGQFASLHRGKYDAADSFQLVSFDPSIPPQGQWRSLTPLRDITGAG